MLERGVKVQEFLDKITTKAFDTTQDKAEKKAVCISCGKPILGFKDEVSVKEYRITGMCQECQDEVYGGMEE